MKIDNSTKTIGSVPRPAVPRAAGTRTAATGVSPENPSAEQPATVVSTSFHSASGSEAVVDAQKVAEIRQAISEGRFQINPERIADGLIGSVREMLARESQTP